jgi:hypothetical protein
MHPRLLGVRSRLGPRRELGRHPDVVGLQPGDEIAVADLLQRGGRREAAEQGQCALRLAYIQRAFQRGEVLGELLAQSVHLAGVVGADGPGLDLAQGDDVGDHLR